jgi:hypothetical protein
MKIHNDIIGLRIAAAVPALRLALRRCGRPAFLGVPE